MKNLTPVLLAAGTAIFSACASLPEKDSVECNQTEGFAWNGQPGVYKNLTFDGRKIARYAYERLDESSDEARDRTIKPFHHIYDWEGEDFITKGPGGRFTHHRGIYYGFNQVEFTREDGSVGKADTWHAVRGAYQEHLETVSLSNSTNHASKSTRIAWYGEGGEHFATELRTVRFSFNTEGDLIVDVTANLSTHLPKVSLDGDAQHAGLQFRASNEVNDVTAAETYFLRPDGIAPKGDTRNPANNPTKSGDPGTYDLPFKGMSFVVGGERYTVAYLDHPTNPRPAWHSERAYGRFGSYFIREITPERSQTVNYRFVIRKGEFALEELAAMAGRS